MRISRFILTLGVCFGFADIAYGHPPIVTITGPSSATLPCEQKVPFLTDIDIKIKSEDISRTKNINVLVNGKTLPGFPTGTKRVFDATTLSCTTVMKSITDSCSVTTDTAKISVPWTVQSAGTYKIKVVAPWGAAIGTAEKTITFTAATNCSGTPVPTATPTGTPTPTPEKTATPQKTAVATPLPQEECKEGCDCSEPKNADCDVCKDKSSCNMAPPPMIAAAFLLDNKYPCSRVVFGCIVSKIAKNFRGGQYGKFGECYDTATIEAHVAAYFDECTKEEQDKKDAGSCNACPSDGKKKDKDHGKGKGDKDKGKGHKK